MAWYMITHESVGRREWDVGEHPDELEGLISTIEQQTHLTLANCHYFDSRRKTYVPNTEWDDLLTGEIVLRCDRIVEIQPLVGHPAESGCKGLRYDRSQTLELWISPNLAKMLEAGELRAKVGNMRDDLAKELHKAVPSIRIRDYSKLTSNQCQFVFEGVPRDTCDVSSERPLEDVAEMLESNIRKYSCLLPD